MSVLKPHIKTAQQKQWNRNIIQQLFVESTPMYESRNPDKETQKLHILTKKKKKTCKSGCKINAIMQNWKPKMNWKFIASVCTNNTTV